MDVADLFVFVQELPRKRYPSFHSPLPDASFHKRLASFIPSPLNFPSIPLLRGTRKKCVDGEIAATRSLHGLQAAF